MAPVFEYLEVFDANLIKCNVINVSSNVSSMPPTARKLS